MHVPCRALQEHSSELTAFEQSEVLQFQTIYFWGPLANKIKGATICRTPTLPQEQLQPQPSAQGSDSVQGALQRVCTIAPCEAHLAQCSDARCPAHGG
jgi:hypothetical protein